MASKIVSKSFGSCKMVNIVWLGLPYTPDTVDPRMWPAMIDALQKIRKDIKANKLQGKAYINISNGFEDARWTKTDKMMISMNEAVIGVTKLDALVVMAAGNNGQPIFAYPQTLGSINNRVVVIGAVDSAGNPWTDQSTADFVKISAAGNNTAVIRTNQGGSLGPITVSGTSFSKYLLRTSKERNAFDHDNRCAICGWSIGLPTNDRYQIQCEIYERQVVG